MGYDVHHPVREPGHALVGAPVRQLYQALRQGTGRRGGRAVVAVLDRGGMFAGLMVVSICLLAVLLVPLGWWRPLIVGPAVAVVVVPVWRLVRQLPAPAHRRTPARAAAVCLLMVTGFTAWAGLTHSEHVVLRRDAGAYALFGQWLATRHQLPVTGDVQAFGGPAATHVPGFALGSPAFYQTGVGSGDATVWQVTPQFLLGAPALYSIGWWVGGWTGMFWTPALLAGLGVLAFAGLAVRLVGTRPALLATAVLAVSQPMVHTARSTYSEPPALLLLLASAGLAVDAITVGTRGQVARARWLGMVAGLLAGLAGLVRVDALREVALLIPVCAVLALRRHPAAAPLGAGALLGVMVSMVPAWLLSRPYLQAVWPGSLRPLSVAAVGLVAVSVTVVAVVRCRSRCRAPSQLTPLRQRPDAAPRRPQIAAALAVLASGLVLASRPWWTVQRHAPGDPSRAMIASLQVQQRLPVDGLRTYAEQSVWWLTWYVGPVSVLAALATFAVLAAAAVRWWHRSPTQCPEHAPRHRPVPPWLVPAAVALGSVLVTLYRPGITPDHPWADRRLATLVLPATALAAAAAAAQVIRRTRDRMGARRAGLVRAGTMAALLLPPAAVTAPLAFSRTEVGEPAAVAQVCSALRPDDVVAMISDAIGGTRAQNEWTQVVRGVCGHPAVTLSGPQVQQQAAVRTLGPLAAAAGRRLVLLAAAGTDENAAAALTALGLSPVQVTDLVTREDQRMLTHPATATARLAVDVWLAPWPPTPTP
jgi:hypothetical protein